MARRLRPLEAGFTLIEVMVTIAVAAVLLGLAAPAFRELIASQRIKTASFDLYSALSYARSEAVKRNTTVTLRAGETSDGSWVSGWRIVAGGTTLRSWKAVPNLTVTEGAGSATSLSFGADGRLTTGTAAPKLEVASAVSLSGVSLRCVQVDLSGRPTTKLGACP